MRSGALLKLSVLSPAPVLNTERDCKEIPPSKRGDEKICFCHVSVNTYFFLRMMNQEIFSLKCELWDGVGNITSDERTALANLKKT